MIGEMGIILGRLQFAIFVVLIIAIVVGAAVAIGWLAAR
jgi:hypothetical protein